MKLSTDRARLAEALAWVAQAVPKRPQFPAMAGIKLAAHEDDTLVLTGFDFDVSHTVTIAAAVAEPGECLVPGLFVRDVLAKLRGADVDLALEDGSVTIRSGRPSFRVRTLAIEEYPSLPDVPTPTGSASADDLRWLVATVKHPIDVDHPNEKVRGLRLIAAGSDLRAVGASPQRVATALVPWTGEAFAATVDPDDFSAAIKGLAGGVGIAYSEGLVAVTDAHHAVTLRTYASEYLPWERVIDLREPGCVVTVDRADLAEALDRATLVSGRETARVTLDMGPDGVALAASAEEADADDVVAAEHSGQPMVKVSNPRFLLDALSTVADDVVALGVVDTDSSCTFSITPQTQRSLFIIAGVSPGRS